MNLTYIAHIRLIVDIHYAVKMLNHQRIAAPTSTASDVSSPIHALLAGNAGLDAKVSSYETRNADITVPGEKPAAIVEFTEQVANLYSAIWAHQSSTKLASWGAKMIRCRLRPEE